MFEGVSVALVTPFRKGELDEESLRRLVGYVVGQGVHGLVATGSTGETPTLSRDERERVWRVIREEAPKEVFVLAGTGTNSTRETLELTRAAAETGVDGCMVVVPYYNKPTPGGLLAHFTAVAEGSSLPLMLYNVPSRTGTNMLPATVAELAKHENIVAVKEASGNVDQATEILRRCPGLTVLSGEDSLTLPILAAGGSGVVSVAGHVAGTHLVAMREHYLAGRVKEAAEMHRRLLPLIQVLFRETNPAPVKAALAQLGVLENELRLPLVPVGEETSRLIRAELDRLEPAPKRG